jgi:hypothetical protein
MYILSSGQLLLDFIEATVTFFVSIFQLALLGVEYLSDCLLLKKNKRNMTEVGETIMATKPLKEDKFIHSIDTRICYSI